MLTDDQRRRYARNITLPEIGEAGQEALLAARVLVVGAGGLGSALISYLAVAGVGTLGIADDDRVELSNLQRQILHETGDIGRLKAGSARDRVEELNPDVNVIVHTDRIYAGNCAALVAQYDIVADGSDNFATRFVMNQACVAHRKPLVSAALAAWEGQVAVFQPHLAATQPCYRCLVSASPEDERGCRDRGVLGAFAGVVGTLQAQEVIKLLLGISTLTGKLFSINGKTLVTKTSLVLKDNSCDCCSVK